MQMAGAGVRRVLARFDSFSPSARQFLAFSLLISIGAAIFNLVFNLYMSALGFSNALIGVFNALPALALLGIHLPFPPLSPSRRWPIGSVTGCSCSAAADWRPSRRWCSPWRVRR